MIVQKRFLATVAKGILASKPSLHKKSQRSARKLQFQLISICFIADSLRDLDLFYITLVFLPMQFILLAKSSRATQATSQVGIHWSDR